MVFDSGSLEVLFEDNHFIAVNKPAGILVQGDKTGDTPLSDIVKQWIREKYNKPGNVFCGIIHRIDRPVSGLVLMARTSKGLERMNALFQERQVQKTYLALVTRRPPAEAGELEHYLVKNEANNTVRAYNNHVPDSLYANLEYRLLSQVGAHYLLEVKPHTGRAHQIRVQLAAMGCPIAGDLKYGAPEPNPDASICLHSLSLEFVHPIKKEKLTLRAPEPYWIR